LDNIIEESSEDEGKSEVGYAYAGDTARMPDLLAPHNQPMSQQSEEEGKSEDSDDY